MEGNTLTDGFVLESDNLNALQAGGAFQFVASSASTSTRVLGILQNDATGATGTTLLSLRTAATGAQLELRSTAAGAAGARLELYQLSASPANNDVVGEITFYGNDDNTSKIELGQIRHLVTSVASGAHQSAFHFYCTSGGAENETFRILGTGKVQVNIASEIAGSTGVADVFDDVKDLEIIGKWRKDPALRQEFVEDLCAIGAAERKDDGGYMYNLQSCLGLTWGAFNKVTEWLRSLDQRLVLLEVPGSRIVDVAV